MKSFAYSFLVLAVLLAPFAIEPIGRFLSPESKVISSPQPLRALPPEASESSSQESSEALAFETSAPIEPPAPEAQTIEPKPDEPAPAAPAGSEDERVVEERFDLSQSDLKPSDVAPFYNPMYPPHRIAYYQFPDGEPQVFLPRGETPAGTANRENSRPAPSGLYDPSSEGDRVLRLSNPALIDGILAGRSKEISPEANIEVTPVSQDSPSSGSSSSGSSGGSADGSSAPPPPKRIRLPENAWRPVRFNRGKTDSGGVIALRAPIEFSLRGPDFTLDEIDEEDPDALLNLQKKVLSFGHGGSLLLEITGGGELLDGLGADFVIYENVFSYGGGKLYQEFARVGVSPSPDLASFRWFECRPDLGRISGCAGVVPTAKGGDTFDLASIGVKNARFILIQDLGNNANINKGKDRKGKAKEGKNTEGFDLDSLRMIHAYSKGN